MIPHGLSDGPLWEQKHTVDQIKVLQLSRWSIRGSTRRTLSSPAATCSIRSGFRNTRNFRILLSGHLCLHGAEDERAQRLHGVEHWGAGKDGRAYLIELIRGCFEAPELESTALSL